jgi:anti-sigma B factor antagonist
MRIETINGEGVTFMEVTGEVDLAVADELRAAGLAALTPSARTLRIDLHGVTFMDSSGIAALVAIHKAAGTRHTVVVQNSQPQVRRIFEITGLTSVFESHPVAASGGRRVGQPNAADSVSP